MVGQILETHKSENEVGPLTCINMGERLDFSVRIKRTLSENHYTNKNIHIESSIKILDFRKYT